MTISEPVVIEVKRSESGIYEIPGAAEPEEANEVEGDANRVEAYGDLHGWAPWTRVYRVEDRYGDVRWYFGAPRLCECGVATGERCVATLDENQVVVEYMPEHLRASHEAAGNSGVYPANGAERLSVTPECAELLTHEADEDGELGEPSAWARIVA